MILNGRAWKKLPPDLQQILSGAFNDAVLKEREDVRALDEATQADLKAKGMIINTTKPDSFRAALKKAGFYEEWHKKFGNEAWGLLEQYVGKLS